MKCTVENKISFVRSLSKPLSTHQENINNIEYHVFEHIDHKWKQEYLVINYVGGARTVRNCNGNSFSAVFEELAKYLDSGYYTEEQNYLHYENDPKWKRFDLEV